MPYFVKGMHGIFSIGGSVNQDIEIVARFGCYRDKLLILSVNIINKGSVALRGQRVAGFCGFLRLCGRCRFGYFVFLSAACIGSHGKAARKDKGGSKCHKGM